MRKRILSSVTVAMLTLLLGFSSFAGMEATPVKKEVQVASVQEEKIEKKEVKKEGTDKAEKSEKQKKEAKGGASSQEANQAEHQASVASGGSNKGSQPTHTHNYSSPVYSTTQTYVVDQAAWTETISEPVYEMQPVWYCSTCGADITSNPGGHLDETMHGGYWNDWKQVQTGTNTYTVTHPEVGHYESQSVVTGYQCSCGAVQ